MRGVILDTDVASLSIKQRLPPTLLRELLDTQVGITFVTSGELTRWATLRQWGPTRRTSSPPGSPPARRFRTPTTSHASGARSRRTQTRRGRPRPQNDTWIAACCLAYGLPLATLNVKDFRDFAEHEGLVLVGG